MCVHMAHHEICIVELFLYVLHYCDVNFFPFIVMMTNTGGCDGNFHIFFLLFWNFTTAQKIFQFTSSLLTACCDIIYGHVFFLLAQTTTKRSFFFCCPYQFQFNLFATTKMGRKLLAFLISFVDVLDIRFAVT